MVQVTFDTGKDTLEELEHTRGLLERAIAARKGSKDARGTAPEERPGNEDQPADAGEKTILEEETTLDTPFLKITVKSDERQAPPEKAPTLNELLSDKGITEDELHDLFKRTSTMEETKEEKSKNEETGAYLEIIEYTEEEKKD